MTEVELVVQSIGDVVVVNLGSSAILDGITVEAVARRLFELVDQQARRKILLDFSQVKFLSSSMLGVLIRLQKRSGAIKGRVVICGLRPELHKVFKITRLDKVLEFADTEETALKMLNVTT